MRHSARMAVLLHALEALPGTGRYSVTFRRADGLEHSAVVHVEGTAIIVAEAALPDGWSAGSPEYEAMADVVLTLHRAREIAPRGAQLVDADGGWDVSLGNVELVDGEPTCVAHGPMAHGGEELFECAVCGARARYAALSRQE